MLAHQMAKACASAGLPTASGYDEQVHLMRLFAAVDRTLRVLDPAVYALPASAGSPGMLERRRLRSLWLGPAKPSPEELAGAVSAAANQLAEWRRLGGTGEPRLPDGYAVLSQLFAEAEQLLDALREFVPIGPDATAAVAALAADQDTPWKLPRLYELVHRFGDLSLHPLLDELARVSASAALAVDAFDYAWYSSILDRIRARDPRYAAERGDALDEIASDFRERDVEHLAANRLRVRRRWAGLAREAIDRQRNRP